MRQHPLSRAITRTDVKELRIGPDVAPTLILGDDDALVGDAPDVEAALVSWCRSGTPPVPVHTVESKKVSRKLVAGLVLSPLVLAAAYLVACLPFALGHRERTATAIGELESFQERLSRLEAEVGPRESIGRPLRGSCAVLLTTPVEQQVGWVAPFPPGLAHGSAYGGDAPSDYPRQTAHRLPPSGGALWLTTLGARPHGREATLAASFVEIGIDPSSWDRYSQRTDVPSVRGVSVALVGRPYAFAVDQVSMAVKVVDLAKDAVVCEGDLSVDLLPPADLRHALPMALLLPTCEGRADDPSSRGEGLCSEVTRAAKLSPEAVARPGPSTPSPNQRSALDR
jgi:hypothetical protein